MINTRATRVSATVFHKHKYISNPNVTPADTVIAAAGNLASALKGTMPTCLQQSPLADLTRLSEISWRWQPHHFPPRKRLAPASMQRTRVFCNKYQAKSTETATRRLSRARPTEHLTSRQLNHSLCLYFSKGGATLHHRSKGRAAQRTPKVNQTQQNIPARPCISKG